MNAGLKRGRLVAVVKWLSALVLLSTVAVSGAAHAARVAVLVPQIEADNPVSEGRRNKFHDTLVAGLKDAASADMSVVPSDEIRFALGDHPELLFCKDGPCLQQSAQALKADRLILVHMSVKGSVGGSAYKVEVTVYDGGANLLPATGSESCGDSSEGCNLSRAFATLKRSMAGIAAQLSSPVQPEKPPVAATTPTTPAEAPMALKDPLQPPPAPAPSAAPVGESPYHKVYHYGWIVAAVATGVFIIASIPSLSYAGRDGKSTCDPSVPLNQCPTVYTGNLATGLGLLLGGGLASAGTGIVLLLLDRREHRRMSAAPRVQLEAPRLSFGSEGAMLSLSGRF